MKPFIDRSIGLIENPINPITTAPSSATINFDQYRQGVEVNLTRYYLQSNIPYVSSKGIITGDSEIVDHENLQLNFGQGMNLDGFKPFEDQLTPATAAGILTAGLVQSEDDPFFGRTAQDGQIEIFSDTGKRSLLPTGMPFNARGLRGSLTTLGWFYNINNSNQSNFLDATDQFLNVAVEGYRGEDKVFEPFVDVNIVNKFSMKIDYTYIGPGDKLSSTGYDNYGSIYVTDSIAYGGFLR
jgi:hypothetical protein